MNNLKITVFTCLVGLAVCGVIYPVTESPRAQGKRLARDGAQSGFLYKTRGEYPSSIELMKKLLPILQDACEAAMPRTAFPGTTEWFRARRAEQKCINVRELELRIERAEREFAARMCDGKINAAQR